MRTRSLVVGYFPAIFLTKSDAPHRDGLDVGSRLPLLATWIGHADPKWT